MNKVLILEDETEQLNELRSIISENFKEWELKSVTNVSDAKKIIDESNEDGLFDLFFLDIKLSEDENDKGGFEVAAYIRDNSNYYKTPILFITAIMGDINYALTNYHCYSFIVKPYAKQDILFQIEQMMLTKYIENKIVISDINRVKYCVNCDDILYLESKGHVKNVYTVNGVIRTRMHSLKDFAKKLGNGFFQCHKCYMINKKHIGNVDFSNGIILVKDDCIPIGRNFKKSIKTCVEKIK